LAVDAWAYSWDLYSVPGIYIVPLANDHGTILVPCYFYAGTIPLCLGSMSSQV
jgi:hypothetical protein